MLALLTTVVAVVETLVILYNAATGYVPMSTVGEFLVRVGFGTAVATPVAVVVVALDAGLLRFFDRRLPWERAFVQRLMVEVPLAAFAGALLIAILTSILHVVIPYREGLPRNLINNSLIAAVCNVLIMAGLEAYSAWHRGRDERRRAEILERENAAIRFEMLKTQLNPHFLFNSLNVLSSLIGKDPGRAHHFVDEFAAVYRYILDVIDLPVVELQRELGFVRSYVYLQSLRFADAVRVDIEVPSDHLDLLIPPLALQTVVENAFKHNRATAEAPLHIAISGQDGLLTVRNNLQARVTAAPSTGIGLENLRKRFDLLGGAVPHFTMADDHFIATLPLIHCE